MESNYQVIARKWRPKSFAELVGQEAIVQTLVNAIQNNRIAHAYLFIGPKGTGKTSTARLFAQALNCEGGPKVDPDPQSPICQAILQGSCMDVIEIDGASNNSVDQIRDLREDCQYTPAQCRFKIYIIDEVHMLSTAAFNALLKTLEEPPAHVKFIFATTESQKILPTILSRCQIFQFKPLNLPTLVQKLELIAKTEGISLKPEAAATIARLAKGGMRDAQSMLDQLIAFCGKAISEEDVQSVYGLVNQQLLHALVSALSAQDYSSILSLSAQLVQDGADLLRVFSDLQETVRTRLLDLLKQPQDEQNLNPDLFIRLLDSLKSSETQIKTGLSEEINFEIALLRASEQARSRPIDQLIKRLHTASPEASQKLDQSAPSTTHTKKTRISQPDAPSLSLAHEEDLETQAHDHSSYSNEYAPPQIATSAIESPNTDEAPSYGLDTQTLEASVNSLPASTKAILEKDFKAHFVGLRR